MLDDTRLEKLTALAGGRFALTALMEKRMKELILNSPRIGETDTQQIFETVLDEIESGRIKLTLPEDKSKTAADVLGGDA